MPGVERSRIKTRQSIEHAQVMGALIVILSTLTAFFVLALLVLTFREFICLLTYLWKKAALVGFYMLLAVAGYYGAKYYLDTMSAGAIGILIVFILNAFSYRAYRQTYHELLAQQGLGSSRRIGRKKLLEVYRLGGKPVDRCQLCSEQGLTLDIHHIVPLSEGGNNELPNLQLLCPNCHRREHDEMRVSG